MLNNIVVPLLIVVSGFICLEYFIPIAIGELIAGIIGSLFLDLEKTPWIEFLSQLGLISLMFLAGFEIDLPTLYRNRYKSIVVGIVSFFIPFILILLLCFLFKMAFLPSVLMGIGLSTTSLAIVFPILREKISVPNLNLNFFYSSFLLSVSLHRRQGCTKPPSLSFLELSFQ